MYYVFTYIDKPAADLQAPKYVLRHDNFTISCRGTQARMRVLSSHCLVISKSTYQEKDEVHLKFEVVAHVEKACEVQCFSGTKLDRKTIAVMGRFSNEKS